MAIRLGVERKKDKTAVNKQTLANSECPPAVYRVLIKKKLSLNSAGTVAACIAFPGGEGKPTLPVDEFN